MVVVASVVVVVDWTGGGVVFVDAVTAAVVGTGGAVLELGAPDTSTPHAEAISAIAAKNGENLEFFTLTAPYLY